MKSPPTLVLASTSAYRRELLSRLQIPFECRAPGVVETRLADEAPRALVARLAFEKASAVAAQRPDAWIIGSDQVAILANAPGGPGGPDALVLGKPGTAANCVEQLLRCSGRSLTFATAVTVMHLADAAGSHFIDETRVTFRTLDRATVERYVAHEPSPDCAGGFKCEGLGIALCESIESGDPTALIGLPLIRLSALLRSAGFDLP